TGVLGATKSPGSIIKGLQAGRCFASEAPLLELKCNGKPMGSKLRPKRGAVLKLRLRAADSFGLNTVRLISGGEVIKEIHAKGAQLVDETLTRKATGGRTYFRLECAANDDLRAFSAPIYVNW
ncbi:MAG: CehA/McbA family metallohydrolase domain-containing protein, partial [Planctomycetota bacterium]